MTTKSTRTAAGPVSESNGHPSALQKLNQQAKVKLKQKEITIGDVELIVHEMTAKGKLEFSGFLASRHKDEQSIMRDLFPMQARLIFLTVTDKSGKKLVEREDDIDQLGLLDEDTFEAMYKASAELNGLNQKKTDLEAEKNSQAIPT